MNSYSYIEYIRRLVSKLDEQIPNWRSTHILLIDNAPSHSSDVTRAVLSSLQVPVCFSAPASYSCLPVERVFGILRHHEHDLNKSFKYLNETRHEAKTRFSLTELLMDALARRLEQLRGETVRRIFRSSFREGLSRFIRLENV